MNLLFLCIIISYLFRHDNILYRTYLFIYLLIYCCFYLLILMQCPGSFSKLQVPVWAHGAPDNHIIKQTPICKKKNKIRCWQRVINNAVRTDRKNCKCLQRQVCSLLWIWMVETNKDGEGQLRSCLLLQDCTLTPQVASWQSCSHSPSTGPWTHKAVVRSFRYNTAPSIRGHDMARREVTEG